MITDAYTMLTPYVNRSTKDNELLGIKIVLFMLKSLQNRLAKQLKWAEMC